MNTTALLVPPGERAGLADETLVLSLPLDRISIYELVVMNVIN